MNCGMCEACFVELDVQHFVRHVRASCHLVGDAPFVHLSPICEAAQADEGLHLEAIDDIAHDCAGWILTIDACGVVSWRSRCRCRRRDVCEVEDVIWFSYASPAVLDADIVLHLRRHTDAIPNHGLPLERQHASGRCSARIGIE